MSLYFIRACNNTATRLPSNCWSHIFSTFLCYWLNWSFWVNIAFRWTDEGIHHFISCKAFSSVFSFDIESEKVAIWSPWESGIIRKGLLILVKRNLVDKIKFHIELNEGAIFSNDVKVLLSWWKGCSSNTVFIFCFYIDNRISINCENCSSFSNTQYFILFDQVFCKKDFRSC